MNVLIFAAGMVVGSMITFLVLTKISKRNKEIQMLSTEMKVAQLEIENLRGELQR
jgi:uncharacterized membrane-anchored protein YhcB (DUF1043 family)